MAEEPLEKLEEGLFMVGVGLEWSGGRISLSF